MFMTALRFEDRLASLLGALSQLASDDDNDGNCDVGGAVTTMLLPPSIVGISTYITATAGSNVSSVRP